jgi:Ca2+/Na+ antiporter
MSDDADSTGPDLGKMAGAISAAIAVVASLAVTGVLARAQRNHGEHVLLGLSLIVLAALIVFLVALPHRWVSLFYAAAAAVFAAGLGVAIFAVRETQKDSQRPAVEAEFDPATHILKSTVTADGLSTNVLMRVRVDDLAYNPATRAYAIVGLPLFYAGLGPDQDGQIRYTAQAVVPADGEAVGVTVWAESGKKPACTEQPGVLESEQAGCLVMRLKPSG